MLHEVKSLGGYIARVLVGPERDGRESQQDQTSEESEDANFKHHGAGALRSEVVVDRLAHVGERRFSIFCFLHSAN